jgi:hypothetical protein
MSSLCSFRISVSIKVGIGATTTVETPCSHISVTWSTFLRHLLYSISSIQHGLRRCKRQKLHVRHSCSNFIQRYSPSLQYRAFKGILFTNSWYNITFVFLRTYSYWNDSQTQFKKTFGLVLWEKVRPDIKLLIQILFYLNTEAKIYESCRAGKSILMLGEYWFKAVSRWYVSSTQGSIRINSSL